MKAGRSLVFFNCLWVCCIAFSYSQETNGCQAQDFINLGQQIAAFRVTVQRQGFTSDQIEGLVRGYQEALLKSKTFCNSPSSSPSTAAAGAPPQPAAAPKPANSGKGEGSTPQAQAAAHPAPGSKTPNPRPQRPSISEAASPPIPTTPTISGTLTNGATAIQGTAQAPDSTYSSQIYVCVWPTAETYDCSAGGSARAGLTGGVSSVPVQQGGTFTANLANPLQAGQYVSLVEKLTPIGAGSTQTAISAQAVVVNQTAPTTPTISGTLGDGTTTIQGTAQAPDSSYSSQIYVCVWSAAETYDCSAGGSARAGLTGGVSSVPVQQGGTFTANLANPLQAGQYVSLVEKLTPIGAGSTQTATSAKAVAVNLTAPPTPAVPAILGPLTNGTVFLQGTGQAPDSSYSSSKISICISATNQTPDCTQAGSKSTLAQLKDGKTSLQTKTEGTFEATLANPLKFGDYVSLVEVSQPSPSSGSSAPQSAVSKDALIVGPSIPMIQGSLDDGDTFFEGSGQASSQIYLCVWATLPSGSLDCTTPKSTVKPVSLANSSNETPGHSDYVVVAQSGGSGGTFRVQLPSSTPLKAGQYVSLVEVPDPSAANPESVFSAQPVLVGSPTPGTTSSLYTLGLTGVNTTSTSASGPNLQYFASFDTIAPLPFLGPVCTPDKTMIHPLSQRCWVWMNPRIASAPAPSSTAISSFSSPSSLASGIGGQTVSQITQTFDLQAGLGIGLRGPWNGTQFGLSRSWARITPSLIVAGGVTMPLNSINNAPEFTLNNNLGTQFNDNPSLATTYPVLAKALCDYGYTADPPCTTSNSTPTYKYVSFVLPNRSRFYSNYSGGFRLSTYFWTGSCRDKTDPSCKVQNIFPGIFDIRFGQDETVTAGMLRGVVMTLGGSYPLPGTNGTMRIYGASFQRLHHNQNTIALAVQPVTSPVAITDPSVVVQPIAASDQDYYRLGIGVDLISLIAKWMNSSSSNSNSSSAAQTTTTTTQTTNNQ